MSQKFDSRFEYRIPRFRLAWWKSHQQRTAKTTGRIFFGIVLAGWFLTSSVAFARENLSFAILDFPPFGYSENGKAAGPGVEIITAVCQELGAQCQFQVLPNRRSKQALEDGRVHGHFPLGWNAKRAENHYFSIPIVNTSYAFFSKKGSGLSYKRLEDLQGRMVEVFGPSNTLVSLETLQASLKPKGLKPMAIEVHPSADVTGLRMVSHGRADFCYSNKDVATALMKQGGITNVDNAGRHRDVEYFVGFRKTPDQKSLVSRFNRAIQSLHQRGVIAQILRKYGMDIADTSESALKRYQILTSP